LGIDAAGGPGRTVRIALIGVPDRPSRSRPRRLRSPHMLLVPRVPRLAAGLAAILMLAAAAPLQAALPRLVVAGNHRFLATAEGKPFFWLGDTAWELFHRLSREEAGRYLANRARLRFTVIQAVVLAELDGLHAPNAYGERPLVDDDPTKPNE